MEEIEVARGRGRRRIQLYNLENPFNDAKAHWKMFCRRFSDVAHIKHKYVSYIVRAVLNTIREMVSIGDKVKLPGIGDFYIGISDPNECNYTPLYKRYIHAGQKPKICFRFSRKWVEGFQSMVIERDAYIVDPISFEFQPSYDYVKYYQAKNAILKIQEIHQEGRNRRPMPIYTPEDIDRRCLELGIEYPPFVGYKKKSDFRLTREQLLEAIAMYKASKNIE